MDTGNNSNFKELKEILNNKKKSFNKSELVNQLLSNIPKKIVEYMQVMGVYKKIIVKKNYRMRS